MLGDLPLSDLAAIEEHVDSCDRCQRKASHFDGLRDPLLLDLPLALAPAPDGEITRRWERLTHAIAGAARMLTATAEPVAPRSPIAPKDYPVPPGFERGAMISAGGFGVVFAARLMRSNTDCVLKYPRQDMLSTPRLVARFHRECLVVKRLRHKGIVGYVDHGVVDTTPYLAQEYLQGQPLSRVVELDGPLALPEVRRIAAEILEVLAHLDTLGVIHRDLKPSNLFRLMDGSVRVIDWGLSSMPSAHLLPDIDPLETGPWSTMGTPGYCAPEQIANFAGCDIRADLYSFGWTLANLLTGKPPGRALANATQPLCCGDDNSLPLLSIRPDLPQEWVEYLRQLVAEEPHQRFATTRIALERLPVAAGSQTAARVIPPIGAVPQIAAPSVAVPPAAIVPAVVRSGVVPPQTNRASDLSGIVAAVDAVAHHHQHARMKRGVEAARAALQCTAFRVLVTGAVGVGKSTVVRALLPELASLFPHFNNASNPAKFRYAAKGNMVDAAPEHPPTTLAIDLPSDFLARGFVVTECTAQQNPNSEAADFWIDADLVVVVLSPDEVVPAIIRERYAQHLRAAAHPHPLWLIHRMDTLRRARDGERLRGYARDVLSALEAGGDLAFTADGEQGAADLAGGLRDVQTWLLEQRSTQTPFLRRVRPLLLLRDSVQLASLSREVPLGATESILAEIHTRLAWEQSRRESS